MFQQFRSRPSRSKALATLAALFLCVNVAAAGDPICDAIRGVSVTVCNSEGLHFGSGTLLVKGGEVYVLTAHHVVKGDHCTGDRFSVTQFKSSLDGVETVVTYRGKLSTTLPDEDAALISLGKLEGVAGCKVADKPPSVDDPIIHCGSYGGGGGSNVFRHSIAKGSVVGLGRYLKDQLFDTGDFTMYPGSSGGGVFNAAGELIGFVSRGMGDRACLFVPARRLATLLDPAKTGTVKPTGVGCSCGNAACKCGK